MQHVLLDGRLESALNVLKRTVGLWQHMFGRGKKFRSIDELENKLERRLKEARPIGLRKKIRIAVIDDKDFSPLENLRRNQFDITYFNDLPTINDVESFQIILVDLQGIGQYLNPSQQGLHIIREIKKNYPEKFVIAYTGGARSEILASSVEIADKYTKKDTSIEDWCSLLDDAIKSLTNPALVWRKFRIALLEKGASPIQLAELEHEFVASFDESDLAYKRRLGQLVQNIDLPNAAREIVISLITNAILAAFTS